MTSPSRQLTILLSLGLFLEMLAQPSDSLRFPLLPFDPFENFQFVSFNRLPSADDNGFAFSNYDYLVPFGMSLQAKLITKNNYQLVGSASIKTQFLFRHENSALLNGIRKTHFNTDFFFRLHNVFHLSSSDHLRLTFFHRSTHLGDDYTILNRVASTNYWSMDEGNYESTQMQYAHTQRRWMLYGGIQYITRGDTPRERLEIQQGALLRNFLKGAAGEKMFLGYDLRLLENNNYAADILYGIGYQVAKNSHIRVEYFRGHIPFSRQERLIDTWWIGIGYYLNVYSIAL